jgi:hypothetical protein
VLRDTELIAHNRGEHRRHAGAVGRVYIRTSFEKFLNNRKVARGACPHQSGCSCFVPRIDRSPVVEKQVHDLDATQRRG